MVKSEKAKITSIDLFKVICAYLVVAVHVHPFKEIHPELEYIFRNIIPRVAVPFFFTVGGYFFSKSLAKDSKAGFRYLKRLITTYSIWTLIYYVYDYIVNFRGSGNTLGKWVFNNIEKFLIDGSWYHLWYFPAIIISVIIVIIFNKLRAIKVLAVASIPLYILGVVGCAYYRLGIQYQALAKIYRHPEFNLFRRVILMGLVFFMLGYIIHLFQSRIEKMRNSTLTILLIVTIILFAVEIEMVRSTGIAANIVLTFFLYPLTALALMLCIKNPTYNVGNIGGYARYIANFTYYAHPLIIEFLFNISERLTGAEMTRTPTYFLTCTIATVIAWAMYKFNVKWFLKLIA